MAKEANFLSTPISFAERLAASDLFKTLFRDGMKLVEDTAAYLDGAGREDAKGLPRFAALAYASESMRLTTRLMQIASWLLLQRAVNEGEITQADARKDKKSAIAWQETPSDESAAASLPPQLLALIQQSVRVQERVMYLDSAISERPPEQPTTTVTHPIEGQLSLLRAAFCN